MTKAGVLSVSPSQLALLDAWLSNIRYNVCENLFVVLIWLQTFLFHSSHSHNTTASLETKCFVVVETLGSNIIVYVIL